MNVPLIDLSVFGDVTSATEMDDQKKKLVALQLREACENVGFFYITGHGCPQAILDAMMDYTRRLFDLPYDDENGGGGKCEFEARNNALWRGYNSVETGAHSCTPHDAAEHLPDLKESFTIGAEESEDSADSAQISPMHGPNQWPNEVKHPSLAGFQTATRQYWHAMHYIVGIRLLTALAMSLDLPDADFFTSKIKRNPHSQMVLLRYPPAPVPVAAAADADADPSTDEKDDSDKNDSTQCNNNIQRRRGCGAHTDCGFVTILLQDSKGLEVQRSDGTWVSAPPLKEQPAVDVDHGSISSALVVNLGDLMAHWTNDRYQSTPHRVYNPSVTQARHSIPFFLAVDYDTIVETIPSCRNHRHDGKVYEPCQSGEYILKKLGLMHLAKAATAGNVVR